MIGVMHSGNDRINEDTDTHMCISVRGSMMRKSYSNVMMSYLGLSIFRTYMYRCMS